VRHRQIVCDALKRLLFTEGFQLDDFRASSLFSQVDPPLLRHRLHAELFICFLQRIRLGRTLQQMRKLAPWLWINWRNTRCLHGRLQLSHR
jgi:hypothetical protein